MIKSKLYLKQLLCCWLCEQIILQSLQEDKHTYLNSSHNEDKHPSIAFLSDSVQFIWRFYEGLVCKPNSIYWEAHDAFINSNIAARSLSLSSSESNFHYCYQQLHMATWIAMCRRHLHIMLNLPFFFVYGWYLAKLGNNTFVAEVCDRYLWLQFLLSRGTIPLSFCQTAF